MGLAGVDRQAWGLAEKYGASSWEGFFQIVGTTCDMFVRVVLAPCGFYPPDASNSDMGEMYWWMLAAGRGWCFEHPSDGHSSLRLI